MSRIERKQEGHLSFHTVNSPESLRALRKFSVLLKACAGPCGKNHVIRNSCGGHVTVTGSCARILSSLSITRPELKLISASVLAHLQRCGDGGLFMAHMCTQIVLLSSSLGFQFHTIRGLLETFLNIIISHLQESECKVTVNVDFDKLSVLLAYVRSVLSSKSLLNLSFCDCDSLSRHVVKVFLESVPNEPDGFRWNSDRIYCISVDNQQFSSTFVEPGILLLYPDCPVVRGSQKLWLKTHPMNVETSKKLGIPESSTFVKVALFTCSMSGDLDEMVEAHFEVTKHQEEQVEASVVTTMLRLCETLEACGVGILLCQKVIHPKVKAALRSKGICFVDRLGFHVVPYLQDLTGAQPLASVVKWSDLEGSLGWVASATHRVQFDKSYLLLSRPDSPVVTFVLCGPWEEKLVELKSCVRSALRGLGALMRERKLLMGGGCWQVYASQVLKVKVLEQLKSLTEELSCSEGQVLKALTVFRAALQSWALGLAEEDTESLLVDPTSYHAWRVPKGKEEMLSSDRLAPCCCGMKVTSSGNLSEFQYVSVGELLTTSDQFGLGGPVLSEKVEERLEDSLVVLDSYLAMTSALKQAVATANLVLSIGQVIVDRN
ncbi:McKusick-Kaufman/Bardet-Biedl syndromes putative chaperonin [Aplysia californica]|uniref:McKusick-Kaufman/Bardet-Biedl syndromes putative chaperonin n=1 Tax=Aplysia californica TaxID=6500 RepID=A0ABM0K802_APLCA|nr:McKusick-Kaufman/Bardet-Biedl syndromes putative chaperonin [Aplysia californica]